MKLNLGSGSLKLEDYENIDIKDGKSAYPLDVEDGSCDEIRASHLLEHFSHRDAFGVLTHWVSKLKDGGVLKIAVPDFAHIVECYKSGQDERFPLYLMGGQADETDVHKSIFDAESLRNLMQTSGLSGIREWQSDQEDCASLPVSLNLMGYKRAKTRKKIAAVSSMPRLCFTDNMTCITKQLVSNGIPFLRTGGAFWGQCLTRAIEVQLLTDADYILTIDYDTWFYYEDVLELCQILDAYPEYDAVAPLQIKRESDTAMVGVASADKMIPMTYFVGKEIVDAETAHFGLTVFRRSAFDKLKKPWFMPIPDKEGGWNDGRVDEDINFWKNFAACGCKLGLAPNVKIGHMELTVTYPGKMMDAWKPVIARVSELESQPKPQWLYQE